MGFKVNSGGISRTHYYLNSIEDGLRSAHHILALTIQATAEHSQVNSM